MSYYDIWEMFPLETWEEIETTEEEVVLLSVINGGFISCGVDNVSI